MFGFINLYKPAGLTSRDCVNIVSGNLQNRKVGHAGTLDPIALGVLVIAVGKATRLIEYVQQQPKRYRARFQLGLQSPSLDTETEQTAVSPHVIPTRQALERACQSQIGSILQVPPIYSALKVDGQRAYDLARRGQKVEICPREVDIFSCTLVEYGFPYFELLIECGSGTYVRSIGRDVAEAVGSSAIMTHLLREAIGVFDHTSAASLEDFRTAPPKLKHLQPLELAVANLPQFVAEESQCLALQQGKSVEIDVSADTATLAILNPNNELCSIAQRREHTWRPVKNF
jgi:tRNA pseudouridine55 synthase